MRLWYALFPEAVFAKDSYSVCIVAGENARQTCLRFGYRNSPTCLGSLFYRLVTNVEIESHLESVLCRLGALCPALLSLRSVTRLNVPVSSTPRGIR